MSQPLFYWNDKLTKADPHILTIICRIGSSDVYPIYTSFPFINVINGESLTQAQIDAFLGTSSEFTAAQFADAAINANCMAGLINMGGQAASVQAMTYCCNDYGLPTYGTSLALMSVIPQKDASSTAGTFWLSVGASGNIGFKVLFTTPIYVTGTSSPTCVPGTAFDSIADGCAYFQIYWTSK